MIVCNVALCLKYVAMSNDHCVLYVFCLHFESCYCVILLSLLLLYLCLTTDYFALYVYIMYYVFYVLFYT